jgi:TP901 family phage tail tape measure protein
MDGPHDRPVTFRTIEVKLVASVAEFRAQLAAAGKATKELGTDIARSAAEGNRAAEAMGKGLVVAGAAGALALGKAASVGMDFQKTMSGVLAVSGATADEMRRLEEAALAAGASTKLAGVTASDAAAAQAELVKAGVSVDEILGGALMGSLTLASAGQLEFADAATIAAQAMNIFDLSGSEVSHVADVLAAAANKSAADVSQLGDALRQGGLLAAQTGLSLEETVGALSAFADNALIGSDAGTSLKTMLQRLTPQSDEAAGLMEELGFSAFDAAGNFVGLEELAGELQDSLSGLTVQQRSAAMATLFGSDAVRAANILFEQGAAGIADYVDAVDDMGAASRMAAAQNDNLAGDIEALGGALETVMIQGAGHADDVMRGLTQTVTTMVTGVAELDGPLGAVATGLGAAATGASLLGGATLLAAPKIKAAKDALQDMGSAGQFIAGNMGKLATGIGIATTALAVGFYAYGRAAESSREYRDQVEQLTGVLAPVAKGQKDLNDALAEFFELQANDLGRDQVAVLNDLDIALSDLERSITAGGDALDPLRERFRELGIEIRGGLDVGDLKGYGAVAREVAADLGVPVGALQDLIDAIEDWDNAAQDSARSTLETEVATGRLRQSAVDAAIAQNTLADGTINYAGALKDVAPAAADAASETDAFASATEDAVSPLEQLEESIKSVTDALRAQLDPWFAAQDAILSNQQAHRDVEEAHWAVTAAADELAAAIAREGEESWAAQDAAYRLLEAQRNLDQANRDVVRSAMDVTAATTELKAKVDAGVVSFEDAERQLRTWVEQGLITDEQARSTATELGLVGEAADSLGHKSVVIPVDADLSEWERKIQAVYDTQGRVHVGSGVVVNRDGGVYDYAFAGGGVTPAHVAVGTRYKYAEPETGGEAFVPRNGNRSRSLGILSTAAGWYGAAVVPMATGGVVGAPMGGGLDYDRLATALEARSVNLQIIDRRGGLDEAAVARIFVGLMKGRR